MKDYISKTLKEFKKKFAHEYESGSYIQITMEAIEPIEKWLSTKLKKAQEIGKKEAIRKYKPTLDMVYTTEWLRGTYGLDEDDTLNAGEVEELLRTFIDEHSLKGAK